MATTSRNLLGCSLGHAGDAEKGLAKGVLRLENRRRRGLEAFRENHQSQLLLDPLWRITALRYLMKVQPNYGHVNNEVGWKRMYEQLAADVRLFKPLQDRWYRTVRQPANSSELDELPKKLENLEDQAELMNLAATAETFFPVRRGRHSRHGPRPGRRLR